MYEERRGPREKTFFPAPQTHVQAQGSGSAGPRRRGASCRARTRSSSAASAPGICSDCLVHSPTSATLAARCPGGSLLGARTGDRSESVTSARTAITGSRTKAFVRPLVRFSSAGRRHSKRATLSTLGMLLSREATPNVRRVAGRAYADDAPARALPPAPDGEFALLTAPARRSAPPAPPLRRRPRRPRRPRPRPAARRSIPRRAGGPPSRPRSAGAACGPGPRP